jgi:hypothetical protein
MATKFILLLALAFVGSKIVRSRWIGRHIGQASALSGVQVTLGLRAALILSAPLQ